MAVGRDGLRTGLASHLKTFWHIIDRKHALGAEQKGALDGELAHGTATPNRHGITGLDVAILRGLITGRKNIREKNYFLIRQSLRNFYRTDIREGHTRIFSLASGVTAVRVRIPV